MEWVSRSSVVLWKYHYHMMSDFDAPILWFGDIRQSLPERTCSRWEAHLGSCHLSPALRSTKKKKKTLSCYHIQLEYGIFSWWKIQWIASAQVLLKAQSSASPTGCPLSASRRVQRVESRWTLQSCWSSVRFTRSWFSFVSKTSSSNGISIIKRLSCKEQKWKKK